MKVKRKVHLDVTNSLDYYKSLPNAPEYKRKYPQWAYSASSIYINNTRVYGPKPTIHQKMIYSTELIGAKMIDVEEILRALKIPEEIINQIEFEENMEPD